MWLRVIKVRLLWLLVALPQSKLPEPNDCTFVVRSMVCFVDAPFRSGCGSAIVQGTSEFMSSLALEREGCLGSLLQYCSVPGTVVPPFLRQGNK